MAVRKLPPLSSVRGRTPPAGDLATLAFPAVLLATVHFTLTSGVQAALALDHTDLAVHTVLTSAYVHTTDAHLYGNLGSYAVVAAITYGLCYGLGRRRWFRATFVAFLVVLPVLVNATNYVAYQPISLTPTNSRGFSGVVAGFAGFLLVAISDYVHQRYSHEAGVNVGLAIFFVLGVEIVVIYSGTLSPPTAGLFLVGFGLTLGPLGYRGMQMEWNEAGVRLLLSDFVLVLVLAATLVGFTWVLFPADVSAEGGITNIVAHAAGFGWGLVIAAVSGRVVDECVD